jgi:hypothetical protein
MRIRIIWIILVLLVSPLIVRAESKPLPETYVSADEMTTFRYPTGWTFDAEQPGLVIVGTSPKMLNFYDGTISSGDAAVFVFFSNAEDEYLRGYFADDDLVGVTAKLIDTLYSGGGDPNVGFTTPSPTTFADFPALRSDGSFLGNHIFLIVVERPEHIFSMVIGFAAESELKKFEPKLLAIAESVNYRPPSQ